CADAIELLLPDADNRAAKCRERGGGDRTEDAGRGQCGREGRSLEGLQRAPDLRVRLRRCVWRVRRIRGSETLTGAVHFAGLESKIAHEAELRHRTVDALPRPRQLDRNERGFRYPP